MPEHNDEPTTQWEKDEQETRDALARGEGITFDNAQQAVEWLSEPTTPKPHIHEREEFVSENGVLWALCKGCEMVHRSIEWWYGYEQGVRDATAT